MNKLVLSVYYLRDIVLNLLSREQVVLISEPAFWSIYEDCKNIKQHLEGRVSVRIAFTPIGLRHRVVHFASAGTLLKESGLRRVHSSNTIVLTWFHVAEGDEHKRTHIPALNTRVYRIHTSCTITANQLVSHGINREKIVIIPIGTDTTVFHPAAEGERESIRTELGIPEDACVIGSFQKDGSGWGEGLAAKLVKGPDIFCDAMERVATDHQIHVLLTGPARGYVKGRLAAAGIPYTHVRTADADGIARYYRALDLYVISSRAEGGPKALLESAASGVAVVSTAVGMVPDLMKNGIDCTIVPIEQTQLLAEAVSRLLADRPERERLARAAKETAAQYDIRRTVPNYDTEIYRHIVRR